METRANYALIGSIVIMLLIALFGFIIWISKLDLDKSYTEYDVLFTGSVVGLSEGAAVRFKGIGVGEVRKIAIDEKDPTLIRVTIKVLEGTPIFDDSAAMLDTQGFTGLSYILIDAGSGQGKPLKAKPGEERPVIMARASSIQELFSNVPNLIAEASLTLSKLHKLLSDENQQMVTDILKNVHTVSQGIAAKTPELQSTIDNVNAMAGEMKNAAQSYGKLADTIDAAIVEDLRPALKDVRETAASLNKVADDVEGIVADSRAPLTAFTTNTLPEAAQFITEARRLAAALARVAERLERDPAEFFNQGQPEYKAK